MATIVVIDDHGPFRDDLRAVLQAEGLHIMGEADTGRAGIARTLALEPDLVIVDIGLPDIDGFVVAEEIQARGCRTRAVLTSSRDRSSYAKRLSETGLAFVPKDELGAEAIEKAVPG